MKLEDIQVGDLVAPVNGLALGHEVRSHAIRERSGRVEMLDEEGDDYVFVVWDEATEFGQWHWSSELEAAE